MAFSKVSGVHGVKAPGVPNEFEKAVGSQGLDKDEVKRR